MHSAQNYKSKTVRKEMIGRKGKFLGSCKKTVSIGAEVTSGSRLFKASCHRKCTIADDYDDD